MKWCLALILCFGFSGDANAQTKSGEARAWEHESSDIPVNSRIHFGKFDNGMRWAWMANSEPNKRCYLRLHVNAGSLAERENEQGVAHFLEHLAFNGSKHFPAGTLIEWFQKHGMAFGADTNASTSFSETIYKLDLPTPDEKTIREGLVYFRDVADGLTIDEKEVQNEKGVIDGEERERNSPQFRAGMEALRLGLDGTLPAKRLPIGIKEVRDKFDSKIVRGFYERWYRPENTTLVIVGDIGTFNPEGLIRELFADWKAPAGAPDREPALGAASLKHPAFTIFENEIPTVSIEVERVKPWVDRPGNVETWIRDLGVDYARSMLDLRFSELAKKEGAPFLSAGAGSGGGLKVLEGENLSVNCRPEKWKDALAVCEQELRRAIEHGFQQSELDELRADALRGLNEAVEREKTRASTSFLQAILSAAEGRNVPVDAATRKKIFEPRIKELTVEKCHKDFVKAWSEGSIVMNLIGNLDLGKDGGKTLNAVWTESQKTKVEPLKKTELAAFAYASNAEKTGKIKSRKHIEDLDFDQIEFENGVKLNVKKTDFQEKQILISGRLGAGSLTLEPAKNYLGGVASQVFSNSGLGKHSEDDLRKLMAGKQVSGNFGVGEDSFRISGGTTKEDFLLQCELMCAYLNDPGWREEGLRQYLKNVPPFYERLQHDPSGPVAMKFMPALYSNDPRFVLPSQEVSEAVKMQDLRSWLTPWIRDSALELSIVGDIDVDASVKAVAQTFGVLPARKALDRLEDRRKGPSPKTGVTMTEAIDTTIAKSLVFVAFPSTDGIEVARRRNLSFLGTVLNDRVRVEIREKLGASYSPRAGSRASQTFPGDGMITMNAMTNPENVPTLVEACLAVADKLGTDGVTAEEVDRLREPLLNQLRDQQRQNGYWLGVLGEAQTRPSTLDDARKLVEHFKNIKAEDLTPLAKQYLKRARASVLVVNPIKKETKDDAKTGG